MSKKIVYIKLIIVTICLLFICWFIFLFSSILKPVNIDSAIEETIKNEDKIVFDLRKTPKQQKKEIYAHPKEYFKQLYNFAFEDEKFSNCFSYDFFSVYEIVDYYRDTENLVNVLKKFQYSALFNILFDGYRKERKSEVTTLISLDDLPVTENYKQKHSKPLYEEFEFITKKVDNNIYYTKHDMNILCKFFYNYGIGLNEEEKIVTVYETKSIETYRNFDGEIENTVVYDKKGNEITEDSADTREFVFKYTLDEKGYVDDIEYVKVNELDGDKYLNEIWKIVKS